MNNKIIPPFVKMCMSIGTLPTAFTESLSYYETLCWFVSYLNETIIPTINNNGEAVTELQQKFIELQNYVNNYFDNLDVQNEINKKLDQMVEDGTFDDIINNKIFNELNEKVNESIIFNSITTDNTIINTTFKDIRFSIDYAYNSLIYIMQVPKSKKINLVATSGNPLQPTNNPKNLLDLSKANEEYNIYITGGLYNENYEPRGYAVYNNIGYDNNNNPSSYYTGFNENNDLIVTPSEKILSIDNLTSIYKNACGSWCPVIVNGLAFDYSTFPEASETCEKPHPRTLIAEDNNNNIYFINILGRNPYSQGMSYNDIVLYLANKNIKTCANLDGGGSTQLVYNQKMYFQTQDSRYKEGRTITNAFAIAQEGGTTNE